MLLLHVSAPMDHLQGGHLERNRFIMNAVQDVCEVKLQSYQL